MTAFPKAAREMNPSRPDERLVQDCLAGKEEAWSALIEKYKNLIFSIPIKYGFSPEDATDIFQSVCLGLLQELPQLREPRALAAWLIQMTSHKCFRWRRDQKRFVETEAQGIRSDESPAMPEAILAELEREQILREALTELSPDCRRLVDLLFFENPPIPYEDLARNFGMAKGSIGATRMRCLEKLRRWLEKKGFR
ncbi:MAG: sigma-70 family RNA polymerase sigma factor [Acidobacteriaceae bacterium]|nr:sigma-70 family RNA polymerase sigma factor [Acidobacteriaceae bacterium]MBV9779398.1 sigma-70 family RNA polymerase sigma factor [Acidobacteriaceae bacterium]